MAQRVVPVRARSARPRRRRRNERGAVAVVVGLAMPLVFLGIAAFVVDIGMQRVARSDAQAVADVVALDLARHLDGRAAGDPTLAAELDAQKEQSLAGNADAVGETPEVSWQLGRMQDGEFVEVAASEVPTAVRVTTQTEVAFAFASLLGEESGRAMRAAAAESSSTACFRLGSFAAAIRSGDSSVLAPLSDLFGVNLDLVGYQGLANADLRLDQLTSTSVIGSPDELLNGSVLYSDLIAATIEALSRERSVEGADNQVAISVLSKILAASGTAAVGAVTLGNVLHVAPGDRAAMGVELDVLDLIASARLADGEHLLGVPNLQGQVPGVGFQFSGGIYLISAAQLACGAPNTVEAVADTAQLGGTLNIKFTNLPSLNIANIGTLKTPKGTAALTVEVASGTGTLVAPPKPECGAGTPADPSTLSVAVTTGLASYQLTADIGVEGEVRLTDLLGLGLTSVLSNLLGNVLGLPSKLTIEVDVRLTIGTSTSGAGSQADLSIPPNDEIPVSTGSSMQLDVASVVPTVTDVRIGGKTADISAVRALTTPIVDALKTPGKGFIEKTLTPLVANINNDYIGPVARMAGIRLAGADVYGVDVTCGLPRLTE